MRKERENWVGQQCLHIADKHVYVSDYWGNYIVVYETSGKFVTRFGGPVRMRESWILHAVSPLVLMVLFMYVTMLTTEFMIF